MQNKHIFCNLEPFLYYWYIWCPLSSNGKQLNSILKLNNGFLNLIMHDGLLHIRYGLFHSFWWCFPSCMTKNFYKWPCNSDNQHLHMLEFDCIKASGGKMDSKFASLLLNFLESISIFYLSWRCLNIFDAFILWRVSMRNRI